MGEASVPEDNPQHPGHDAAQPALEDLTPDISFDFQTRGDDQDTTIDDSQDVAPDAGNFGEDAEDRVLQALVQADKSGYGITAPGAQEEQLHAPVAPMAVMDISDALPNANIEETGENGTFTPTDAIEGLKRPTQFEIRFPSLSDEYRDKYVRIESDVVETVKGEDISEGGSLFYRVEFTDGRERMVGLSYPLFSLLAPQGFKALLSLAGSTSAVSGRRLSREFLADSDPTHRIQWSAKVVTR